MSGWSESSLSHVDLSLEFGVFLEVMSRSGESTAPLYRLAEWLARVGLEGRPFSISFSGSSESWTDDSLLMARMSIPLLRRAVPLIPVLRGEADRGREARGVLRVERPGRGVMPDVLRTFFNGEGLRGEENRLETSSNPCSSSRCCGSVMPVRLRNSQYHGPMLVAKCSPSSFADSGEVDVARARCSSSGSHGKDKGFERAIGLLEDICKLQVKVWVRWTCLLRG